MTNPYPGTIPVADLPVVTPGPYDSVVGAQNGEARRFPVGAMGDSAFGYATRADLYADLAHPDGTLRWVTNDPTTGYNGLYRKQGASGAGSWVLSADRVSAAAAALAAHQSNTANPHGVTKAQVGLGNVDNTSDAVKPVSGPQAAAINAEATARAAGDAALDLRLDAEEAVTGTLIAAGTAAYTGSGPVHPVATDAAGRVLLGYDATAGVVVGRGVVNTDNVPAIIGSELDDLGQAEFTGVTGVVPVLTDSGGRVLLGYDITNETVVGAGIGAGGAAAAPVQRPIADPPVAAALNHLLFYGQSLSVGATAMTILSTSQPYSNVTFAGGPRAWDGTAQLFAPLKPLVEDAVNPAPDVSANRGETCCSGAANYATTLAATEDGSDPASHVILASTAGHGGWTIDQLDKPAAWYTDYLIKHVQEGKALDASYACHAVAWIQGENDGADSTPYATYYAKLRQLALDIDADIRAVSGQSHPVRLLTYQTATNSAGWREVQRAQLAAAKDDPLIWMVTPIYHLPHNGDGVHLTNVGYKWLGAYFGRAYKRLVRDGVEPRCLMPLSATRRGNVIRVRFDVPHGPLVLDTTTLAQTTDHGFRVTDGGATAAISSVAIDGTEVVITLSAVPTGAVEVRYAMDYIGTGLNISSGGSGNLRDSAPESITISGVKRPLYNVAPHFALTVTALGE